MNRPSRSIFLLDAPLGLHLRPCLHCAARFKRVCMKIRCDLQPDGASLSTLTIVIIVGVSALLLLFTFCIVYRCCCYKRGRKIFSARADVVRNGQFWLVLGFLRRQDIAEERTNEGAWRGVAVGKARGENVIGKERGMFVFFRAQCGFFPVTQRERIRPGQAPSRLGCGGSAR